MQNLRAKLFFRILLALFLMGSIVFSGWQIVRTIEREGGIRILAENIRARYASLSQKEAPAITKEEIIALTNDARHAAAPEAQTLHESYLLDQSAEKKLDDMVAKNYFAHETPEGYNIEYFVDNEGYAYLEVAENLASGDFADAQAIVDAWMASPGHRANIVNASMSEIGVAVSRVEFQGALQYVAVQHFGRPMSECPSIDKTLETKIDSEKSDLGALEQEIDTLKAKIDAEGSGSFNYASDVDAYNALVKSYNTKSATLQNDIALYNQEVRAFNACLGK